MMSQSPLLVRFHDMVFVVAMSRRKRGLADGDSVV